MSKKAILLWHKQKAEGRQRQEAKAEAQLNRFMQLRERAKRDIEAAEYERVVFASMYVLLVILIVINWLIYLVRW